MTEPSFIFIEKQHYFVDHFNDPTKILVYNLVILIAKIRHLKMTILILWHVKVDSLSHFILESKLYNDKNETIRSIKYSNIKFHFKLQTSSSNMTMSDHNHNITKNQNSKKENQLKLRKRIY